MKTFQEITLKDGQPTPPGDLAMELVCKALGICWHKVNEKGICSQGDIVGSIDYHAGTYNPPLLTSLDACFNLFKGITNELLFAIDDSIHEIIVRDSLLVIELKPFHIVEAILRTRTLEDTCPECLGDGYHNHENVHEEIVEHSCTCNNGKVPLYTIWEVRI